jgi:hydrogenase maturation protease
VSRPERPLVLGIGNILLRDEGVGVAVVQRIAMAQAKGVLPLPEGTRVVDGGTLGLDLLPMIEDADQLVIVDAVNLGRPPGTVTILRDESVQAALSGHVSPHQIGVGDLVAAARLTGIMPARLTLIGIQPEAISIGLELTGSVEAAVEVATRLVWMELADPGSAVLDAGSASVGQSAPLRREPLSVGA